MARDDCLVLEQLVTVIRGTVERNIRHGIIRVLTPVPDFSILCVQGLAFAHPPVDPVPFK